MSVQAPRDPQPSTEPSITATVELEALPALLTVAEVAEILRVARSWVYEHAGELFTRYRLMRAADGTYLTTR